MYSLLDDSASDLRSKKFKKLTKAICGLVSFQVLFSFFFKFIYFEREERENQWGGTERGGYRGSEAGSVLTAEIPMRGLNSQTNDIMT